MKPIINITKSEAKQIAVWGTVITNGKNHIQILKDGTFIFDIYCGNEQDSLDYEEEYKEYEWRLTDIKDLEQGDVCMVNYRYCDKDHKSIGMFDCIWNGYRNRDDERTEDWARFWNIHNNRPSEFLENENVYKLFKKSDKK